MRKMLSSRIVRTVFSAVIGLTTAITPSYAETVNKCGPHSTQKPDSAEKSCPEVCEREVNDGTKAGGRTHEYRYLVFKKGEEYAGEHWMMTEDLDKLVEWEFYAYNSQGEPIEGLPDLTDKTHCNYPRPPRYKEIMCGRTCAFTSTFAEACPRLEEIGSIPTPTPGPGQVYETNLFDMQTIALAQPDQWWNDYFDLDQFPIQVKGTGKIHQRILVRGKVDEGTPTPTPFEVGEICETQTLTFYLGAIAVTPTPGFPPSFHVEAYAASGGMKDESCPYPGGTGCPAE